jgi:hypothetical protein
MDKGNVSSDLRGPPERYAAEAMFCRFQVLAGLMFWSESQPRLRRSA